MMPWISVSVMLIDAIWYGFIIYYKNNRQSGGNSYKCNEINIAKFVPIIIP